MAASLAGLVRQATSSIGNRAKEAKEALGWEPYPEPANSSHPPRPQAQPAPAAPPVISPRAQATLRAAARPVPVGAPRPEPKPAAVDPSRQAVNPVQYLRELDGFARSQAKAEIAKAVMTVTATEVEAAINLSARLRGRYLARILDAAQTATKRPFGETETKELTKMREMSEEMARGVEALKRAIESGELNVPGLRQP
jgi:hypothetical protein